MATVTIEPAIAERFDDLEAVLAGGGDGNACQCQWWTTSARTWRTTSKDVREAALANELAAPLAPGLICYLDGEPSAWVRVGPRTSQQRLLGSRVVRAGGTDDLADERVWAITCFSVRSTARGQGLMRRLIGAATAFARANGADRVEAYPVDTAQVQASSNQLFVGTLEAFADAGFALIAHPTPRRAVVAMTLHQQAHTEEDHQ